MGGRGKVVRNAAIFGHHKIINSMRRTQSIGLDIEKEGERCQKGPNPEHSKCCPEGAFRHPISRIMPWGAQDVACSPSA